MNDLHQQAQAAADAAYRRVYAETRSSTRAQNASIAAFTAVLRQRPSAPRPNPIDNNRNDTPTRWRFRNTPASTDYYED